MWIHGDSDDGKLEPGHDELLILSFEKSEKFHYFLSKEKCYKCTTVSIYLSCLDLKISYIGFLLCLIKNCEEDWVVLCV